MLRAPAGTHVSRRVVPIPRRRSSSPHRYRPCSARSARADWSRVGGERLGSGLGLVTLQIFVRVEGRHAAGARGSHGLAIDVVGDISGREDSGDARRSRVALETSLDDDVAAAHVELFFEKLGIWLMSHGNEYPFEVEA